ncbi:MAG TPA: MgtC/SapB family protein [Patescibacteria group bacterium]|nr:MgtC/SapB family protein [Patescibacteria group bacterium]
MTLTDFVIRLSFAFVLGSFIGLERQWRQRTAGLRTNTLVSTGAALFVMMSFMTTNDSSPNRIAAQIVSGIGFLGAGVIMRDGFSIRGLNTAATLWCSAAIGAMAGASFLTESCIGTVAILLANIALRPLAQKVNKTPTDSTEEEIQYDIKITCLAEYETQIRTLLLHMVSGELLALHSLHSKEADDDKTKDVVEARLLSTNGRLDHAVEKIVSQISLETGVTAISWKIIPYDAV